MQYDGNASKVFGPPGTGKTTYLANEVRKIVAGGGPDSVLISSFSTTAAKEISGRFANSALKPNDKMVGTLHSHAFRSVGHGAVALDPKVIKDWNTEHPDLTITADNRRNGGDTGTFVSDPVKAVTGDDHLGCLDLLRSKQIPREEWPRNIAEFADRWTAWKLSVQAVDYTDMIEGAFLRAMDGERPPGYPKYIISDESQDMTRLEMALVLAWGRYVDQVIIAGDDDQAINEWRGGDPEPMVHLTGDDVTDIVLGKSYRVPESVRLIAERWIQRVSLRKDKVYAARTRLDGDVDTGEIIGGSAFHVPERLGDPELVTRLVRDLEAGKDVMVMASCNYMLAPLLSNLRDAGVPFHNPFRPLEGRWNPFGGAQEGVTPTAERVYRYLSLADQDWTGRDVQAWIDMVKIKDAGMVSNAKKLAGTWIPDLIVPEADIYSLFKELDDDMLFGPDGDDDTPRGPFGPDPDWLESVLLKQYKDVAAYPLEVARQHGHQALKSPPKLMVGTVHSFKGAGADVVYVAPDISTAAYRSVHTVAGRDSLVRLFYVAVTRAKESLRMLAPSAGNHVAGMLPPDLEVMG